MQERMLGLALVLIAINAIDTMAGGLNSKSMPVAGKIRLVAHKSPARQ
jgi:hypothetical protein